MSEPETLADTVEVDETYIGGKAKNMHKRVREQKIAGRVASGKTAVIGLVERKGRVYAKPVSSTDNATLQGIVRERVASGATVCTDEFGAYKGLETDYNHGTIRHGTGRYVNGQIHTNTIEGYGSLLKRGIFGIYH